MSLFGDGPIAHCARGKALNDLGCRLNLINRDGIGMLEI